MDAHPELERHGSLAHLRLGRRPVRRDPRTLKLAHYLNTAVVLPTLPDAFDWTQTVPSWPMYGNDGLGDCTWASAGHMIQAWTAAAGSPVAPAEQSVIDAYWATGSADDGRYEIDVLNYWRNVGVDGHKIDAYVAVDAHNHIDVCAAIYLFGGVYAGAALPSSAQNQAVWDVTDATLAGPAAPGSWGGHAIPYLAYDPTGYTCVTWAHPLKLTRGFHDAYCDELYAPISRDFLNAQGLSPAGFDVAALQADLTAIADSRSGAAWGQ